MNKEEIIKYTLIITCIFLFIFIVYYFFNSQMKNTSNCDALNKLYSSGSGLTNFQYTNSAPLYAYYIKSAYNCCATGNFSYDYVNICALKKCVQQGVRFLDFEIYSINNNPVIGTSYIRSDYYKQSFNSVKLEDALDYINSGAFNSSECSNYNDPLILHFRIESQNTKMYNNMAKIIEEKLKDYLLNKETYGQEARNITQEKITKFKKKVIIVVDKSNDKYTTTDLYNYVNLASNGPYLKLLKYTDTIYNTNPTELIEFNKSIGMTICFPDLANQSSNYNPTSIMELGISFPAMCFQVFDSNIEFYNEFFKTHTSAFVFKPDKLLGNVVGLKDIKEQNPDLSLAPMEVTNQFIKYKL